MAKQVIWSPAAEEDLSKLLNYLQLYWNEKVIFKFLNKVDAVISIILKDPKIFPIINNKLQIRKVVITKQNTLYYRISTYKNIEVVRLFDSRQDPDNLIFPAKN